MNERIKEFMQRAGTDSSGKWMGVEHAERFAELIVQECVGILEKEIASKNETVVYNQDEWAKKNFHFTLLTNLVLETKSHFGVE